MDPKQHPPSKEITDVFRVVEDVSLIEPVNKILLPPEEVRKDKLFRIGLAIVIASVVITATVLVNKLIQTIRVNRSLADVAELGTPQSIARALSLVVDRPALRARLLATAALEGDPEALREAEELVHEHWSKAKADPTSTSDWQVASIYLSLTRGEAGRAKEIAEQPGKFDVQATDFLRGRALALLGVGDFDLATESARKAFELRPNSAPLASLLTRVYLEGGRYDDAQKVLDVVGGSAAELPSIKLSLALVEFVRAPDGAQKFAEEVISDERASAREKAWAQLLLAWSAFELGQPTRARSFLQASASLEVPVEVTRVDDMAQLALMLGETKLAKTVLTTLKPSQYLSPTHELTRMWFTLEDSVEKLSNAAKQHMRARLAALSSKNPTLAQIVSAKCERILGFELRSTSTKTLNDFAKDPHYGIAAVQELALALPDAEAGAVLAEKARQLAHNPSVTTLAVAALLRTRDSARALDLAQQSYAAHKEEALAAITLSTALIAADRAADAVSLLQKAHDENPKDVEINVGLGQAAYAAGDVNRARDAYQDALSADSNHAGALLGMLELMMEGRDVAGAARLFEKLKAHELKTQVYDEVRARYLVWRQPGRDSRTQIAAAARRHLDSWKLQMYLAQSNLQAGLYSGAAGAFQQARSKGGPDALMRASAAFALGLGNMGQSAENTLDKIESEEPLNAQARAMIDLAKAAIGIGKKKPFGARAFALRAQKALPNSSYVALVMAEGLGGKNKSAVDQWRRALTLEPPLPLAAGRLALILGASEEGCALAKNYFSIIEYDPARKDVREAVKDCPK